MRSNRLIPLCAVAVGAVAALSCLNTEPGVYRMVVTPASATMSVGETRQFTAVGVTAAGDELPNIAITWRSSNDLVGAASTDGSITALGAGLTLLIATSSEIADSAVILASYSTAPVATLVVFPVDSLTIEVGSSVILNAILRGANGEHLIDRDVDWTSDDDTIVRVGQTGLTTAVLPGRTTVRAMCEGKTGSTVVIVIPATLER